MKLDSPFNIEDFGFVPLKNKPNAYEILLGDYGYEAYEFIEYGGGMYVINVIPILSNNKIWNDVLTFDVPQTNRQFIDSVMDDLDNMRNRRDADELVNLLNCSYRSGLIDEALEEL